MRKDRIHKYVIERFAEQDTDLRPPGVTAREVSEALGVWRNDCTVELNKLVAEGKLCRQGKKDVRFFPVDDESKKKRISGVPPGQTSVAERSGRGPVKESSVFSCMVGSNGSLKHQVRIAKAAISYPPFGLNMLITGPTGVGKTMFAYLIWEYAKELKAFDKPGGDIPFIHFNCAEYADNPQLLLTNLFGYKKGAFTGAVDDKPGLVQEASGGILLLDEIHCLSSTGQELFFTLLDTGFYRRIGDVVRRQSRFMLIGTTTKPATDVLLDTFMRRIPILIRIPKLADRPLNERREFIEYFYRQEVNKIRRPIIVKKDALNILVNYTSVANLGTLRNVIQISCAKGYHRNLSKNTETNEVIITFGDILLQASEHTEMDEENHLSTMKFSSDLHVSAENGAGKAHPPVFSDVYDYVEAQLDVESPGQLTPDAMHQIITSYVDNYFENLKRILAESGTDMDLLGSIILPGAVQVSAKFLEMASKELNCVYAATAPLLLSMHISQYIDRIRSGISVFPVDFHPLAQSGAKDIQFVMKMKDWLSSAINTDITDDELGFLAIFLRQGQEKMKNPGVWITLVSCNEHTASSIGNFINAILTPCHIHWVDGKPVNSMHNIFEILCDSIKMFHGAGGNLIFTDIDVLTGLEYELYRATGVKCRVIPSLDHHLIVEACKTTMASDCALDGICRSIIENHCESMLRFYSSYGIDMPAVFKKPRQTSPAKVILTICVTGVGSAQRIKEILERKLYYIPNLTIVAMSSLDDTAGAAAAYGPSLKLIVGTINPGILNTPFLSSGSVFTTNGLYYISTILNDWNCNFYNIDSNFADYKGDELNHILNDAFSFIAPNVEAKNAVPGIFRMIDALEEIVYSGRLPDDIKARIFMHAASMLERIISGNVLEMDDDAEKLIARKKNWFTLLEDVIQNAFKPYGYGIPREENYYFMLSLPETGDLQSK